MEFYRTRFTEKLNESLKAVSPIIAIVVLLSFTITPVPRVYCSCFYSERYF